jgi:hypothetical protein
MEGFQVIMVAIDENIGGLVRRRLYDRAICPWSEFAAVIPLYV